MKKISTLLTSLLFVMSVFTNAYSAGDEEAIKKLSSFKKTGIDVVADVIDQNTKYRANIENILESRMLNNKTKKPRFGVVCVFCCVCNILYFSDKS